MPDATFMPSLICQKLKNLRLRAFARNCMSSPDALLTRACEQFRKGSKMDPARLKKPLLRADFKLEIELTPEALALRQCKKPVRTFYSSAISCIPAKGFRRRLYRRFPAFIPKEAYKEAKNRLIDIILRHSRQFSRAKLTNLRNGDYFCVTQNELPVLFTRKLQEGI